MCLDLNGAEVKTWQEVLARHLAASYDDAMLGNLEHLGMLADHLDWKVQCVVPLVLVEMSV